METKQDTFKIDVLPGDVFSRVATNAQSVAKDYGVTAEYSFNGIRCLVDAETNLDWLYRDYTNAFLMDWKEIGPFCQETYSPEVQVELEQRTKESEIRAELRRKEIEQKDDAERQVFAAKTNGIEIELANPDLYQCGKDKNTDPYGSCIYQYADGWARLMQAELATGRTVAECAESTSYELGFLGITGFMYGAAVSILSECWIHGEALRQWHNGKYNHKGNGVVNPAILTLSTP